jgi:hypothetical protein
MVPSATPQLVANNGLRALRLAISELERFAYEPKVDGVRGLVVYQHGGTIDTRNRRGERRDWLRGDAFEGGLRRLADRMPILWHGTVLDGTSERGQAAYNERRRYLRDQGIEVIPDLYNDDELDDDSSSSWGSAAADYWEADYWRDRAAADAANAAQKREWSRQDEHANDHFPRRN